MHGLKAIPRGIWALGLVSMFMDISSEMIHGLLPVFLVSVLGARAVSIGLIEGIGEGIALVARVFSGALSDWLGKRKALVVAGYLLGTLTKPLFAIATGIGLVLTARSLDRLGKGLRGAPRDALVGDMAPPKFRGTAYGLRQSLDSFGAVMGPLLAIALMSATMNDFRSVFWFAIIPGIIAVAILVLVVQEPAHPSDKPVKLPVRRSEIPVLGAAYWTVVAIGAVFTLARFSEAFLLLRAESVGLAHGMVPIILVTMSLVYALGAYPAGRLSDYIGRSKLLCAGLVTLIVSNLLLAKATNVLEVVFGAALWGLHMALTQGLFAALVADTARQEFRGTAFGVYGLASGIAIFIASVFAGWLWDQYGAPATFLAGAAFSLLALVGLLILRWYSPIKFKLS